MGPTFQYLQIYARGENSDAVVGSMIRLNRNLYIDTERDTLLLGTADVGSRAMFINAGRDLRIDGETESVMTPTYRRSAYHDRRRVPSGSLFIFGPPCRSMAR